MIYFVTNPADGLIKIGRTVALKYRLRALVREYGPLTVLGVVDEARYQESGLHRLFGPLWSEREWFRAGEELMEFIATHAREWSPADDMAAVRLPSALVEQARTVAAIEGCPLPHLLTEILAPALAIREAEALARRAAAVGIVTGDF